MSFDRCQHRGLAGLSLAALLSVAPAASRAAEAPAVAATTQTKGDEVDAEMLRDLEVVGNPNYARDRELAKRMSFLERMRMLQALPWVSNQPPPGGATLPAGPVRSR